MPARKESKHREKCSEWPKPMTSNKKKTSRNLKLIKILLRMHLTLSLLLVIQEAKWISKKLKELCKKLIRLNKSIRKQFIML
jgi:hypothetical protein